MNTDSTRSREDGSVSDGRTGAVARVLSRVIITYQRYISPLLGPHCRFYPSCSEYARTAVVRHGVGRGGLLAVRRLLRCHPFHPGGVDLVPEGRQCDAELGRLRSDVEMGCRDEKVR